MITLDQFFQIAICGINRNIVECKSDAGIERKENGSCINRNIVECKYKGVNGWWIFDGGINRNIVECK